jgi:hypothetical protein
MAWSGRTLEVGFRLQVTGFSIEDLMPVACNLDSPEAHSFCTAITFRVQGFVWCVGSPSATLKRVSGSGGMKEAHAQLHTR